MFKYVFANKFRWIFFQGEIYINFTLHGVLINVPSRGNLYFNCSTVKEFHGDDLPE